MARELPSKTEQTVYCELEPEQRKLYDELRQHYRDSLLRRIETANLAKSKIQILEALLRLHGWLLPSRLARFETLQRIQRQTGRTARATA